MAIRYCNKSNTLTRPTQVLLDEENQWLRKVMSNQKPPPDPHENALGKLAGKHKGCISSENVKRRLQLKSYIKHRYLTRCIELIAGEYDVIRENGGLL